MNRIVFEEALSIKNNLSDASIFIVCSVEIAESEIQNIADYLLSIGCKNFHICGSYESDWHNIIDLEDIKLFPDNEKVALTFGYENIEDFAFEVLSLTDGYLLYGTEEDIHIVEQAMETVKSDEETEREIE